MRVSLPTFILLPSPPPPPPSPLSSPPISSPLLPSLPGGTMFIGLMAPLFLNAVRWDTVREVLLLATLADLGYLVNLRRPSLPERSI